MAKPKKTAAEKPRQLAGGSPFLAMAARLESIHARQAQLCDLKSALAAGASCSGATEGQAEGWWRALDAEGDALLLAMTRGEPATLADCALMLTAADYLTAMKVRLEKPEESEDPEGMQTIAAVLASMRAVMWHLLRHCRASVPHGFVDAYAAGDWRSHGPEADEMPPVYRQGAGIGAA